LIIRRHAAAKGLLRRGCAPSTMAAMAEVTDMDIVEVRKELAARGYKEGSRCSCGSKTLTFLPDNARHTTDNNDTCVLRCQVFRTRGRLAKLAHRMCRLLAAEIEAGGPPPKPLEEYEGRDDVVLSASTALEEDDEVLCAGVKLSGEVCSNVLAPGALTAFCSKRCQRNDDLRRANERKMLDEITEAESAAAELAAEKAKKEAKAKPIPTNTPKPKIKHKPKRPVASPPPPPADVSPVRVVVVEPPQWRPMVTASPPATHGFRLGAPPAAEDAVLVDEYGECALCLSEGSADRRLDCPGAHEFCQTCVDEWRFRTVLKAQKGTQCPLCRGVFTKTKTLVATSPVAVEAPEAAAEAQLVRAAVARLSAQQAAARLSSNQWPSPGQTPAPPTAAEATEAALAAALLTPAARPAARESPWGNPVTPDIPPVHVTPRGPAPAADEEDLAALLDVLDCAWYLPLLLAEEVEDVETLLLMEIHDLVDLGIPPAGAAALREQLDDLF